MTASSTSMTRDAFSLVTDVRAVDEGADELDALLVAERQILEIVAGAVGEPEVGEPPARLGGGVVGGQAAEAAEVLQLLLHPHRRVQPALLG
jgi:hypothetical protein